MENSEKIKTFIFIKDIIALMICVILNLAMLSYDFYYLLSVLSFCLNMYVLIMQPSFKCKLKNIKSILAKDYYLFMFCFMVVLFFQQYDDLGIAFNEVNVFYVITYQAITIAMYIYSFILYPPRLKD